MPTPQLSLLWIDPFARTRCGSVLLSDHIRLLVDQVKLIDPFDQASLRPAAYDLHVGDEYYENDIKKTLSPGQWFTIPSNGLVYVKTKEVFNVPYYLIARYSLRVTQVYRGLLIDNGLHVDPGYSGPIWIPVHNFTSQERNLSQGEEFLSVEFNRTTPLPSSLKRVPTERALVEMALNNGLHGHRGYPVKLFYKRLEQFDNRSTPVTPLYFWNKSRGETHKSAMIASEERAREQVQELDRTVQGRVERFQTAFDRRIEQLRNFGLYGGLLLLVALLGVLLPILYAAFMGEKQAVMEQGVKIQELEHEIQKLKDVPRGTGPGPTVSNPKPQGNSATVPPAR